MKKYAVDQIINDIAFLEDLETKEKKEIELSTLPESISDGDILIYENNIYRKDELEKQSRIEIIRAKMEKLKNKSQ